MIASGELGRARERLAETEALIAKGLGGPYAEQNLKLHRTRVARLEASAAVIALVAALPASTPPPAMKPVRTRLDRIQRLAQAMGARPDLLEAALKADMSPDAFVMAVLGDQEIEAIVAGILAT